MKKFFTMFAFVAALIIGGVTFTSCGSDDDDNSMLATYTFSFKAEYASQSNDATIQSTIKSMNELFKTSFNKEMVGTKATAEIAWNKVMSEQGDGTQASLNALAKEINDKTLTLTMSLSYKNGSKEEVYKTKTWTANY